MRDRNLDIRFTNDTKLAAASAAAAERSSWKHWIARMAPALKHTSFRWLWISSFLSNIGTWMQGLAQGWLVFQLTHSAFWLGVVAFTFSIPGLLLTLVGGVVADHLNRRLILIVTQSVMMVSAFIMSALIFFKSITIPEILALTALTGIATAINMPSYHSLLPRLVSRNELTNAVALNSAQFHTSRILGPALGGFVIAWMGVEANFLIIGISFLAPIIALARVRNMHEGARQEGGFWVRLKRGFSYLFDHPELSSLLLLIAAGSFLALPYMSFVPYFARDILNSNERGLGMLMACSGAGSVCGAGTVAYLDMVKSRGKFLFVSGLAFFTIIVLFCFSKSFILSGALLMGAGYASVLMGATANAVVQHIVAERMRGRVMSIYFMVITGLPPIGGLVAGSLSHAFPAAYVLAAMAALAFAGSMAIFAASSALRGVD